MTTALGITRAVSVAQLKLQLAGLIARSSSDADVLSAIADIRTVLGDIQGGTDVTSWGALADGTTDDTAAILAAIGTGGHKVLFPAGTYYIAQSDGINILYSDVDLVFARGAVLKVAPNCAAITLARAANTTINRIGIFGARIIASDGVSVNTGIRIAPDATNIANFVTISDCIVDGMGQYGIVIASLSGGASHLTIRNTKILNNGSTVGTHGRNGLILNPSVASASHDLSIADCYVEQINDAGAGAYETDACKIQNFTNVWVNNFTCKGGGSAAITGNTLIFNNNTNLVATNLLVVCTNGGGLQLDTSATGVHEITGCTITGTIGGSNAVILATNGSNKLSMRGIHTAGSLTGIGTHERMEISDSVFDGGIDTSGCTAWNNGVIRGCTTRKAIYVKGASNIVRDNVSISSNSYGVRVAGDSNIVDGMYTFTPTNGAVNIVSGTGNSIGRLSGNDLTIVDAGTSTVRLNAHWTGTGAVGTYTAADATPNVAGIAHMHIANGGAVNITNFLGGIEGQEITLTFADGNSTVTRANAQLAGGANFVSTAGDVLKLVKRGAEWWECSRSANS